MDSDKALPPFLEFLKRNRDNAGVMADLRCALIPTREHRVWPHIGPYFRIDNDRERTAAATTAAAFGTQPEAGGQWDNMGDVMRQIAFGNDGKEGLTTFGARFQRLIACDSTEELSAQLHGIFKAAQQNGIPINHRNLFKDVLFWGDAVKRRWAGHFYAAGVQEPPAGGGADE